MSERRPRSLVFEVRIEGSVPEDVLHDLTDVQVVTQELRTSLRADIRDQSELHGFLARLRAYGLEIVEVRRVVAAEGPDRSEES